MRAPVSWRYPKCRSSGTTHVAEWQKLNARFITRLGSGRSPSPGHEYMLYQALIGAWPLTPFDASFVQRIEEYAIKAAREGKLETSWLNPNDEYEQGLRRFVQAILDRDQPKAFLESLASFARRTSLLGALNSLSQLVLKATMPGVPDFYQGTESWDFSLVDPDNRRPVDFTQRRIALGTMAGAATDWGALATQWADGRIKFTLTHRLLTLRNAWPALFRGGAYEPIEVTGPHRDHVLAFARSAGRDRVVVAVGRHFAPITGEGVRWPEGWQGALNLDPKDRPGLHDALGSVADSASLELADLFKVLPVAVLSSRPPAAT